MTLPPDILDRPNRLRLSCSPGLADQLASEIDALGYVVKDQHPTGVDTVGSLRDTMRLNLHVRTAFNVQYLLKGFRCRKPDALYQHVKSIPWEDWIDPDGYVTVNSHTDTPAITNSMFASVKVKDAIVDRINEHVGRRPDSGPERDRTVVTLYWVGPRAWLYLNTSGQKLADRGYRKIPHAAPMRETLAAGVVLATGYTGEQPLLAPMCGSGTLAIEAALIATGRAPGLLRANFGLMHVRPYDEEAWRAARREAKKSTRKGEIAPIIASDIDPLAVDAARRNAQTAGVDHLIEFHVCDFAETPIPADPGVIIMNPEYGDRLGDIDRLEGVYERIGDWFKQSCAGWTGFIFTGSSRLAKKVGLRASRRFPYVHGGIDCRLLRYELYSGTRRTDREESTAS